MLETFKISPKIGLVSPKIYFAPGFEFHKDRYKEEDLGKVIWYAGGEFDWDNIGNIHRGIDEVDQGQYDPPAGGEHSEIFLEFQKVLPNLTESVNKLDRMTKGIKEPQKK